MQNRKIITLRKAWGLSQDELAKLLGMTRTNLSRLELGGKFYALEAALKLEALFNMSIATIFAALRHAAYDELAARLADFSRQIEGEEGALADRKRQLLSEFASRTPEADAAV